MAKFTHKDIKGLIPPLPTAFTEDGKIDAQGQKNIVRHVLGTDERPYVDGIFVCSRTGEFPWLTPDQKREVLDVTLEGAGGRVPVLFGSTGKDLKETIELSRYAERQGADAIVVAPFFFHPSNRRLPDIFVAVDEDVGLPDYAYNNPEFAEMGPRRSERNIKTDVFKKSLERAGNLWGIKDSSGDLERFGNYIRAAKHKPGATVFMGDESKMIHSENFVPSYAALDPITCRRLKNIRMDLETEAASIQELINDSHGVVYCGMKKIRGGLKYALNLIGLCEPFCLEPGQELTAFEKEAIKNFVEKNYRHFMQARRYA